MTISIERRNEIAGLYCLNKLASKPLMSVEVLSHIVCSYTSGNTYVSVEFARFILQKMLDKYFTGIDYYNTTLAYANDEKLQKRFSDLFWEYVVEERFREGIKIGDVTKRTIGNQAKQLNISIDEAMEFEQLVVTEIVKKTFEK